VVRIGNVDAVGEGVAAKRNTRTSARGVTYWLDLSRLPPPQTAFQVWVEGGVMTVDHVLLGPCHSSVTWHLSGSVTSALEHLRAILDLAVLHGRSSRCVLAALALTPREDNAMTARRPHSQNAGCVRAGSLRGLAMFCRQGTTRLIRAS
jgi:hypothetical protein